MEYKTEIACIFTGFGGRCCKYDNQRRKEQTKKCTN